MIRVLVVDDDFMVARIHRGFVERTPGFAVVGAAHTGAQALEAVVALAPDLVLLDVHLPDTTGLELLPALRAAAPEVDVIMVTAAREVETVRAALRGGVVHYLMKPFTDDDLRERLEHYQRAHQGLGRDGEAAQSEVDRVFGLGGSEPLPPKGFSAETLKLVADVVRGEVGDLSATETAERLGMSRVSARRYLEHLASTGKVEIGLRYGEVGRPERRYGWRR